MTEQTISVLQGEYRVSDSPDTMMTTVLGSCIAVCLYDSHRGVGGMNHFLLAHGAPGERETVRYGTYAMELLINDLLKHGANKSRLEAKVFGGARMLDVKTDIGARNAAFAQQFLQDEGIPCVSHCTGGTSARRIRFWPTIGRAQQMVVQEQVVTKIPETRKQEADITLF